MEKASNTCLFKREGGVFYFRRAVPEDLRGIEGRREWKVSLRTRSRAVAMELCAQRIAHTDRLIATHRAKSVERAHCADLEGHDEEKVLERAEQRLRFHTYAATTRFRSRISLNAPKPERMAKVAASLAKNLRQWEEGSPWSNPFADRYEAELARVEEYLGLSITRGSQLERRLREIFWAEFGRRLRAQDALVSGSRSVFESSQSLLRAEHPTLKSLLAMYEREKSPHWSEKSRMKFRTVSAALTSVVGAETKLAKIGREQLRELRDLLEELPPNYTQRSALRGLSLRDAARKSRELELPRLQRKTVVDYTNNLSAIFGFAVREELMDRNPAQRLGVSTPEPDTRRRPFSATELNQLFGSPIFRGCVDDESKWRLPGDSRPMRGRFWVPLIAMHTGMRLNEICFLRQSDVISVEGVWSIRVTAADGRRLKTNAAERIVPIHPQLREIGFLEWVRRRDAVGENGDLFPELPISSKGYRSDGFSKWFRKLRVCANVGASETTFHSFRHYFEDRLRDALVPAEHQERIMGWKPEHIRSRYGDGPSIELLNADMKRVSFPEVDLQPLRFF